MHQLLEKEEPWNGKRSRPADAARETHCVQRHSVANRGKTAGGEWPHFVLPKWSATLWYLLLMRMPLWVVILVTVSAVT
jgi:hypothetical protein